MRYLKIQQLISTASTKTISTASTKRKSRVLFSFDFFFSYRRIYSEIGQPDKRMMFSSLYAKSNGDMKTHKDAMERDFYYICILENPPF